jgi:hypothetical protein
VRLPAINMLDKIESLKSIVWNVVNFLAHPEQIDIYNLFSQSRVTRDDLFRVIEEYGRTLVSPPFGAYDNLNPVRVSDESRELWAVAAPLWTKEEGRSDLSIELTINLFHDQPIVELDDCRVM